MCWPWTSVHTVSGSTRPPTGKRGCELRAVTREYVPSYSVQAPRRPGALTVHTRSDISARVPLHMTAHDSASTTDLGSRTHLENGDHRTGKQLLVIGCPLQSCWAHLTQVSRPCTVGVDRTPVGSRPASVLRLPWIHLQVPTRNVALVIIGGCKTCNFTHANLSLQFCIQLYWQPCRTLHR